jgi:hypothetical protein
MLQERILAICSRALTDVSRSVLMRSSSAVLTSSRVRPANRSDQTRP